MDIEPITITKDDEIIAHHTTESVLSHYGQPVWVIEDEDPEPGPAIWKQGDNEVSIEIIEVRAGWLIIRQPDDLLSGIIWSDGNYFANILEDETGIPCKKLRNHGQRIRGTIQFDPDNSEDLGATL